jgi:hypothetical protein
LSLDDFQWKASRENGAPLLRESLDQYITSAGAGSTINPNFAPELLLRAVPRLNDSQVSAILSARVERPFEDMNDLQSRIGLSPDSSVLRYLAVARNSQAVSSIARLKSAGVRRSERHVMFSFSALNLFNGLTEAKWSLGRLQRNTVPVYLESP